MNECKIYNSFIPNSETPYEELWKRGDKTNLLEQWFAPMNELWRYK